MKRRKVKQILAAKEAELREIKGELKECYKKLVKIEQMLCDLTVDVSLYFNQFTVVESLPKYSNSSAAPQPKWTSGKLPISEWTIDL